MYVIMYNNLYNGYYYTYIKIKKYTYMPPPKKKKMIPWTQFCHRILTPPIGVSIFLTQNKIMYYNYRVIVIILLI